MHLSSYFKEEEDRLTALLNFDILDTDFEKEYDDIVKLTSYICKTPITLISLVDLNRQWFKAKVGLNVRETPRDVAFCSYAIEMEDILIVKDTHKDFRFSDNPLVKGDPKIRFYAGAQLRTSDGHALGTLCAIDREPRELSQDQIDALKTLADQVVARFELRKLYKDLQNQAKELHELNKTKDRIFSIVSHDLRAPFNNILGFSEILKKDINELSKDVIREINDNIADSANSTYDLVNSLLNWSMLRFEKSEIPKSNIVLSQLFDNIFTIVSGDLYKKKITVIYNFDKDIKIHSVYQVLFSAFQNLLTNAIKYTPFGGTISIEIVKFTKSVKVIIKDSGIGMSLSKIEAILNNEKNNSEVGTSGEEGNGLGFSIAKDFIRESGGTMKISSQTGIGTSVEVNLPL